MSIRRAFVFAGNVSLVLALAGLARGVGCARNGPPRDDTKPHLYVEVGHSDVVWSLAWSPDGTTIASADNYGLRIEDVETCREVAHFDSLGGGPGGVAWTADGSALVGASGTQIVVLDSTSGRRLRTVDGLAHTVSNIALSRDDARVAYGLADGTARVSDMTGGAKDAIVLRHATAVNSVAWSPNDEMLATGCADGTVRIWNLETAQIVASLDGHTGPVRRVAWSPDGATLATAGYDKTIILWDVASRRRSATLDGHTSIIWSVEWSHDGSKLASASSDNTVRLWDVASRRPLAVIDGHQRGAAAVAWSPDDSVLASGGADRKIQFWDPKTARRIGTVEVRTSEASRVVWDAAGTRVAVGYFHRVAIWDLVSGRGPTGFVADGAFDFSASPDFRTFATSTRDGNLQLWDVATGRASRILPGNGASIHSPSWSPDGSTLAACREDGTVELWDVAAGRIIAELRGPAGYVIPLAWSPDGRSLATAGDDTTVRIWNVRARSECLVLRGHGADVSALAWRPDGSQLASKDEKGEIRVWDATTGRGLESPPPAGNASGVLTWSPSGRWLAYAVEGGGVEFWDPSSARVVAAIKCDSPVESVTFSPDSRRLVASCASGLCQIWSFDETSIPTFAPLCALVAFDDGTWAVVDHDGRFDASKGGDVAGLHWAVGREIIELAQLKDRYYDPGLLAKHLGLSSEPLRRVEEFADVALSPAVATEPPGANSSILRVALKNRGGGIGRVRVLVNGKEIASDARGPGLDPNAPGASLAVDLAGASVLPGEPNTVEVVAWNAEGYLSSRGVRSVWTPEGRRAVDAPELWAVVVGVSEYASPSLRLRFAGKDACDFATALDLGATRLFGADKVHLALLSTEADPRAVEPTKADLAAAFAAARRARPTDVFVVYFAGHAAVAPGSDTYCYLTRDARGFSDLVDPEVRRSAAVTSDELVAWINAVPALKQAMVLDTCAAGALAARLSAPRELSSDQFRAIDRMKDRTGLFVLMGAAADAVSYEATRFRQGLLTYALLRAMKGAALRDGSYVDVSRLFLYAEDEVPELARGIGGVQRPFVAAPSGASFDVGLLGDDEKRRVPLETVVPLVLRPVFLSEDGDDSLGLSALVGRLLRETSQGGARGGAGLVYVDGDELPGAVVASGIYRTDGDRVRVTVVLKRDGAKIGSVTVEGLAVDAPGLAAKIVSAVRAELPPASD